jgi:hypothetical protein
MEPEIVKKHKPFRLSPVTRMIEEYMSLLAENEIATYEDLTALTGDQCSPSGKHYSNVLSAIRRLEKKGHNFANVENEGYRKLTPDETVDDVGHMHQNQRKRIKRSVVKLEGLDTERLSSGKMIEFLAARTLGRLSARILSARAQQKLIEEIRKQPEPQEIDYEDLTDIYLRKKST